MSIEKFGKILKPCDQIYDFRTLSINNNIYRLGDKYENGIIKHIKAKTDYSDAVLVVEEKGIISHYELN